MMNPKTKKVGGTGLKVLAVCIPALLAFWQARLEARDKARTAEQKATASTEAGYATLVQSVGELQSVAELQHDYIVKLEAHVEVLEKVVLAVAEPTPPASGPAGDHTPRPLIRKAPLAPPLAPVGTIRKPNFTRPPPNLKGAQDRADQLKP